MDSIHNCDKNKLGKVIVKISTLIDETPKESLLRYVFKNEEKFVWEANYLFILNSSGVLKIYDKEIDVDGENIFYLQLLDEVKFYRFKQELFDNRNANFKNDDQPDLLSTIPVGGKLKAVRRITRLFNNRNKVANWKIMACITPYLVHGKKFSKKDYDHHHHYQKIKHCSVTIKKYWKDENYTIKIQRDFSEKVGI